MIIENKCITKNEDKYTSLTNNERKNKDSTLFKEQQNQIKSNESMRKITELSSSTGKGRSVLKQIKCPPSVNQKSIPKFLNTWLPAMENYAMDYIGLGQTFGVKRKKKKQKKATIGSNRFIKIDGKCDFSSNYSCIGKDRHLYLKTYPLGYLPKCVGNTNDKVPIFGDTGLIGNIQEDLYNLSANDVASSLINKGPYSSKKCMRARLPVGDSMLVPSKRRNDEYDAKKKGGGWWVEEHCIPEQLTIEQKYGDEKFDIPHSRSVCQETYVNYDDVSKNNQNDLYYYIFLVFLLFVLIIIMIILKQFR